MSRTILRRIYNRIAYLYNSFFNPPSTDIAFIRRERLAIAYAISSVTLLVITSYTAMKGAIDPSRADKIKLKPPPGSKVITMEIDPMNFNLKKNSHVTEELENENASDDVK